MPDEFIGRLRNLKKHKWKKKRGDDGKTNGCDNDKEV